MDENSLSGLLCQESETCLDEELVEQEETFCDLKDYGVLDDGYTDMLGEREISFGFKRDDKSLVLGDQIKCARSEAIAWILKTRAVFRFRFQTAYLSVTYFDRFLYTRSIDGEKLWAIKLLSVACLSLAAKMEEVKVPALSEFQTEEYKFASNVILRMELLVLTTLDWRMGSITPFAFLRYFIVNFYKDSPPSNNVSRVVALILATMREINLMDHRPSAIAAAATLMALDQRLTKKALECKMNPISYCGFLEIEDVFTCYSIMQKLEIEKLKMRKSIVSPDLSPTHLRTPNVLNCSSVSSAVSTKRKRLTFNDSDQSSDRPNEKRFG
ncbi:cyclin-D5-1-like [Melia azedarach]|uniref:Cyclin-D5-1-like n=1 Tax=Melia azedarach TaxID=155640 RepID=A0ACC1WR39_MELAZ|nr:cyclin-D5-1-like [Melia azedarach]